MFTYKEHDFYIEVSTSDNYHALFTKKNAGNFSFSNPTKSSTFTQLCRKSFIETMKFNSYNVLTVKLIHSNRFIEQHLPHTVPFYTKNSILSEADAIITNNKDLIPTITFADCIPIAVIDSKNSVHIAIHAGWKGIVSQIIPKTINYLYSAYNCKPENLEIIVGPSIFASHYEVQQDFIDYLNLQNVYTIFDRFIEIKQYNQSSDNSKSTHYFYDNRKALKMQLEQCLINDKSIFWIDIDTYSDERYCSYRKNKNDFTAQSLMIYKR